MSDATQGRLADAADTRFDLDVFLDQGVSQLLPVLRALAMLERGLRPT
jgi:hypothetical protein